MYGRVLVAKPNGWVGSEKKWVGGWVAKRNGWVGSEKKWVGG